MLHLSPIWQSASDSDGYERPGCQNEFSRHGRTCFPGSREGSRRADSLRGGSLQSLTTAAEVTERTAGLSETPAGPSRPTLDDLMERAVAIVAIASPPRPTRSRVEWLVGEYERAAEALDLLIELGFLTAVVTDGGEPRLVLGERLWPVRLPGGESS